MSSTVTTSFWRLQMNNCNKRQRLTWRVKNNKRRKDRQHWKTEKMQDPRRWQLLKVSELEWETESLICAAQEQAIIATSVKSGIERQSILPLFRLCKGKVESLTHIVSSCSVLAGNQYKKKHGKLGKKVH